MIRTTARSLRTALRFWKALTRYPRQAYSNQKRDPMAGILDKLKLQLTLAGDNNKEAQLVIEQKNDCLFIHDTKNEFGFLSEVETDQDGKGVVIDIRDRLVGIALYSPSNTVKAVRSTTRSAGKFESKSFRLGATYSVEEEILFAGEGSNKEITLQKKSEEGPLRSSYRQYKPSASQSVPILNPLLGVCYNIKYGDFVVFEGAYGTGKSATAMDIAKVFSKEKNSIVLYLSYNLKDCQRLSQTLSNMDVNFLAFSENEQSRSDAGGLMLALKVADLAKRLKNQGYRVLTILQNVNEVVRRQVSMLKNFHQPLASFSVINDLYCESGAPSFAGEGDLTTIVTMVQESDKNQVDAGYLAKTPYVNSLSHLHSLTVPVQFPLKLRINQNPRALARHVNRLLQLEKQFELKSKLKLNTQPWENYFLLDSKWWVASLRSIKPASHTELELFLQFVEWNIQHQHVSHWKKPAGPAFTLLNKWLQTHNISQQTLLSQPADKFSSVMQAFLLHCKIQGDFEPFAADYLP